MPASYFGIKLRELRKGKDMTQQQLADALGMAKSSISMYENGHHEPAFDTLNEIANFFHVPVGSLLAISYEDAEQEIMEEYGQLWYIVSQIENAKSLEELQAEFDDYIPGNPLFPLAAIKSAKIDLSESERNLVNAYRQASPADRQIIDNIVDRYTSAEKKAKSG